MPCQVSGQTYLDLALALAQRYESLLSASRASDWEALDAGLPEIADCFDRLQASEHTLAPSEGPQATQLLSRLLELDRLLQENIRMRMDDLSILLPKNR